ncbi:hypothetical protein KC721_00905 [Candidatus Woesebacteria bacterium]|nr:hypothetical protein [Candidatus Woesebacteria bacterium]
MIVARIVELNAGNIAYNSNNIPGFADSSELSLVLIPALPDLPSNMELGIAGPSEKVRMHTV